LARTDVLAWVAHEELKAKGVTRRARVDCVDLSRAQMLLGHACAEAERRNLRLAVAVVDAGGHLVALERMDGVEWVAADIAHGKAYTLHGRAPARASPAKSRLR
jgi:uncharacterized protein GlcG (DUF336 family)